MFKLKKLHWVLIVLITALIITVAIFLAFLTTNSKYYKTAKENLNLIAYSNKPYSYYLYDANGASTGHYSNANSISQTFTTRATASQTIYQIKIPVSEVGYYNLNFKVDFAKTSTTENFLISNMTRAVGCQVVHASSEKKALTLLHTGSSIYGVNNTYSANSLYYAEDRYQWKTLSPSYAEQVTLTYKVTDSDVATGYVLWAWEFTAMPVSTSMTISLDEISIEKITELDSTNTDPHFNFAQTSYVNNTVTPKPSSTALGGYGGCETVGYTRQAPSKGTFVTEATANSMTMQLAPLAAAWESASDSPMLGSDGTIFQNYVGINIPLKNIEYNTNYKVSFDFSIARQGTERMHASATRRVDVIYESDYSEFFHEFDSGNSNRTLTFQSYLHSGKVSSRYMNAHTTSVGRGQITLANMRYTNHEVTRYDELRKYSASNADNDYLLNSGTNINSAYNDDGNSSTTDHANMLNAIRHTELNGQHEIFWYTFYNTTFTFNIPSSNNINLNDLYWVWGIDALVPGKYYRVKMENVRIEEVVQFGGNINSNGIKINGTQVSDFNAVEPSYMLRGSSGTGQNYQALAFGTKISMAATNTFNPIYDAKNIDFTSNSENDYKIYLNGTCVCVGGVEKYVWSPDLGKTWHDMIVEKPLTKVNKTTMEDAERKVDQTQIARKDSSSGKSAGSEENSSLFTETLDANGYHALVKDPSAADRSKYLDFVDFQISDTVNSDFTGFKIYADISDYKNVWDMELIFAAVPVDHPDMRCELLRMTNVNHKHDYRAFVNYVSSDIQVVKDYAAYSATNGGYNLTDLYAEDATDVVDTTTATTNLKALDEGSSALSPSTPTKSFVNPFSKIRTLTTADAFLETSGYYSIDNPNSIDKIRTLFSGIPVKTTLNLDGWIISEGGTASYWFSVDNGKTWNETTGSITSGSATNSTYVSSWNNLFGKTVTATDLTNARFTLNIDLSAYEGQLINVIVAAKPTGKDTYCPVAKINNVSVCGNHTYLSKIREITLTQGTGASDLVVPQSSFVKYSMYASNYAYSPFEPYAIDIFASRKLTPAPVPINNGGTISIQGFIYGYGGIKGYKYTLDGGETWINLSQYDNNYFAYPDQAIFKASKLIDWEMNISSGKNGNFDSTYGATKPFELTLPNNLVSGENYDILVVGISGDSTDEKEYLYPLMNLTLNIL